MAGYKISICNYSYTATWRTQKGQIRNESFELRSAPLIGEDPEEIRDDPTGQNQRQLKKNYSRIWKHPKHIDQTRFVFGKIDVLKHYGTTQWIKKTT